MSLRVGTFLPFTLACFLNGHSFLAQELTRAGVAFRKDDNAFLAVAEPWRMSPPWRRPRSA